MTQKFKKKIMQKLIDVKIEMFLQFHSSLKLFAFTCNIYCQKNESKYSLFIATNFLCQYIFK